VLSSGAIIGSVNFCSSWSLTGFKFSKNNITKKELSRAEKKLTNISAIINNIHIVADPNKTENSLKL
jgi:hypothetical protein